MFFSVGQSSKSNFSNHYRFGEFFIDTDAGWQTFESATHCVLYKGYVDSGTWADSLPTIISQTQPVLLGNFCAFVLDVTTGIVQIKTDRYRSFPIFFSPDQEVSNLSQLSHTAWTDSIVEILPGFKIVESKFDAIGHIDSSELTTAQATEQIHKILCHKTKSFLSHNTLPIRVFLSGGVDSALVYSYLQKYTDQLEMVNYEHVDFDHFWLENSGTLKNFWGYRQIHHWKTPCVLASGAPGDEFMLRSPMTADLFLQWHGSSIPTLLSQPRWQQCLHYAYFGQEKNQKFLAHNHMDLNCSREQLIYNLCNILLNDWQHWHIGHTLTWTPLRDLEIIKILLRLPWTEAVGQIMNSDISIALIEKNQPGLSQVISDQKNSGNVLKNLGKFFSTL